MAITAKTIATIQATSEQLARCHRVYDYAKHEYFYQVESESDPTVEYEVHFIPGKGFTCTCPAGQEGFRSCSKGTCKHCRWAVAAARQYKAEVARQTHIEQLMRELQSSAKVTSRISRT